MLKLKKGIHWEELPEDMKPAFPEPGTTVEYRFTETHRDFQKGGISRTVFNHEVTLNPIFNVKTKGGYATVGIVGSYDERGNPTPGSVRQLSFLAQSRGGVLYVHPHNSEDEMDLFMALELHPAVAGNSNEDTNTFKQLRKVDNVAESKKSIELRAFKRKAINLATGLKDGLELERAALLLGLPANLDPLVIRDKIELEAESNPQDFVSKMEDKQSAIKAEFFRGLSDSIIAIDGEGSAVVWTSNKGILCKLTRIDRTSAADEFAEFVDNDPNGKAVYKSLQQMNAAKLKAAQK